MTHPTSTPTLKGTVKRIAIAFVAVVVAVLFAGLVFGVISVAIDGLGESELLVVDMLATEFGFFLVGLVFLRWIRSQSITFERPTGPDLRVGGLALGVAVLAEVGRQILVKLTTVGAGGTVPASETGGLGVALVTMAVMIFVAPPVEEFLFRGVIQRYVRETSSTWTGIAVGTLFFVPMHALGILATTVNLSGIIAILGTLVIVSVAFGIAYARSDNLFVPIGVHAAYNVTTLVIGAIVVGI